MSETLAYAAHVAGQPLEQLSIERREVGDFDVDFDITYCGVCHSDLHQVQNDWGVGVYPMVPGHEVVGVVRAIGPKVTKFKIGDTVGVGCMVDSCRDCSPCKDGEEQFCEAGNTMTYASVDKHLGGPTFGGYSKRMVVDEAFVLSIDKRLPQDAAAPLLCAGITTYSPLKRAGVSSGSKVGIIGLGGLGHMGVKIAKAMGATVCVLTHSPHKVDDALTLGADEVIISSDPVTMAAHANSFDFLLNTVSAKHDINVYFTLLKHDGTITQVGLPSEPMDIGLFPLVIKRINFNGSLIGGIRETQEMLDFCAEHNIASDIELIKMQDINQAFERLEKGDVKYRFVIDLSSL